MKRLDRPRTSWTTLGAAIAALSALCGSTAYAQRSTPPLYPEFRADALVGSGTTVEAGAGAVVPMGVYVRFSVDGAAGANFHDGLTNTAGRIDAIGRFLLDPYREEPIGFSLGGGLTVPFAQRQGRTRPYLAAVMDIEGRMSGRVTPALQIGLGGGTRVGFVLRISPRRWR